MKSISAFKSDGFTIDGTGYFACHQESHRVLYAKTPWCRWIFIATLFALAVIAAVYGLVANAPSVFVVGVMILGGAVWHYAPRKKMKKPRPSFLARFRRRALVIR